MDKFLEYIVFPISVLAIVLGFYFVIWASWCWVLPQIFPTGPQGLIAPSYTLFIIGSTLVFWLAKLLRGN